MRLTSTSSSARRSTSSGLISWTIATGLCASSRQRFGSRSRKISTTSGCHVHHRFRDSTQSFSCSVLPAFIQSNFPSDRSPWAVRSHSRLDGCYFLRPEVFFFDFFADTLVFFAADFLFPNIDSQPSAYF